MRARQYGESLLLLLDIIDELEKLKIDYMAIGAIAVSVHGLPRASIDADAVINIKDNENIKKFVSSLNKKPFKCEVRRGDFNDPISSVIDVKDKYGNRADLLIGIKGIKDDAFTRAKNIRFRNKKFKVASAEDLIAMKAFAGSLQDIEDIKGIIEVQGAKLDKKLLRTILKGYGKRVQNRVNKLF